ncbi:hypothetical protein EVAR_5871_1 [Eumeta japonica]|uniref:Uncharacterized protein n=1 Tax=Eumeta variegata TaxID=151549 RepID=A0A4C1TBX3_EUMVA|nr:hypothetical protein EVAR_5871_1 [Eumeta japonica]
MATNRPSRPNEMEEYINEAMENEDCSETEDYLEASECESESGQEGDNNEKTNLPSENFTRRDFIKTLTISLIQPLLHDRISITNIPQNIKNRIRNIIPEVEPTAAASNPSPPMGGQKVHCGLCDWKKVEKPKFFA